MTITIIKKKQKEEKNASGVGLHIPSKKKISTDGHKIAFLHQTKKGEYLIWHWVLFIPVVLRDYNAAVVKVPIWIILLNCNFLSEVTGKLLLICFVVIVHAFWWFTKFWCVDETVFEQKCVSFRVGVEPICIHCLLKSKKTVKATRPLPLQKIRNKGRIFCWWVFCF